VKLEEANKQAEKKPEIGKENVSEFDLIPIGKIE
jgi:hypothetical protein